MHHWGHVFAFFIMTVLLGWTARTLARCGIAAAGAFLVAFVCELLEVAFYHPNFEWRDIGTDTIGIVVGLVLLIVIRHRRSPAKAVESSS